MNFDPTTLLLTSLCGYAAGATAGLLFVRHQRLTNLFSFGAAALAGIFGTASAIMFLAVPGAESAPVVELLASSIPGMHLEVQLDPLEAFFLLIVSLLGFTLSVYSIGYARGFFGR